MSRHGDEVRDLLTTRQVLFSCEGKAKADNGDREHMMDALDELIARKLETPEFKREWDASEEEYQVSRAVIKARLERGMTQTELAKVSGMDQRVISRVETGETLPTVRTLGKIARGLGDDLVIQFVPRKREAEDEYWEDELMEG